MEKWYGGPHQKSCIALVVALTLFWEDSAIKGDLLDPRTRCRERINGTWRSLLGMICKGIERVEWGSRRVQIRSRSKQHTVQVPPLGGAISDSWTLSLACAGFLVPTSVSGVVYRGRAARKVLSMR